METRRQAVTRLSLTWVNSVKTEGDMPASLDSIEIFAPTRGNVRQVVYGVSREQLLADELLLAEAIHCSILPSDWQDWLVITPTRTLRTGLPSSTERS